MRALSVEVRADSRVLVRGSGEVTSALLQTLAGLWEAGEGRVVRPPGDGVLMLPDRPYLPPGTLREVLIATHDTSHVSDDHIWKAMRAVQIEGVGDRAGGLDVERRWEDILPLEEQRLLGVARILLAAPRFALLERIDAGVGAARAAFVLTALQAGGIGYVVLADEDEALGREHFDAVADIAADGTWSQKPTETVRA